MKRPSWISEPQWRKRSVVLSMRVSMVLKIEPSLANQSDRMTTAAALQQAAVAPVPRPQRRVLVREGRLRHTVGLHCHMLKGVVGTSPFQAVFRLGAHPSDFSVMCRRRLIFGYNARAINIGTEEAKW
jgi:hypothetical protein